MLDIDNILIENIKQKRSRFEEKNNIIHTSAISQCPRKWFFVRMLGESLDDETRKVFLLGNQVHDCLQQILKESIGLFNIKNVYNEHQVSIDCGKFAIIGNIDSLIEFKDNSLHVVEIKSTRQRVSEKTEPNLHHLNQATFYVHSSHAASGQITYVEKNTFETKSFEVVRDDIIYNAMLKKAALMFECLKENRLPSAEASQSAETLWECRWCPFLSRCKKIELNRR